MQVWDQVMSTAGQYADKAGVVIAVDIATETASIKLDGVEIPVTFDFAELKFLGR